MFPSPAKSLRCTLKQHTEISHSDVVESPADLKERYRTPASMKGQQLNVQHFLSNNGKTAQLVRYRGCEFVDFDYLRGKHLVICCFHVPKRTTNADSCRALIDSYDDLVRGLPFEIILVIKMKSCFTDYKFLFDQFVSAFPCLAIPFSDYETRDNICSSIGVDSAIVVNPEGLVLQHHKTLTFFRMYGSEWDPFLDSTVLAIATHDQLLRERFDPIDSFTNAPNASKPWINPIGEPLSLSQDILLVDPSQDLHRVGGGSSKVGDLAKKHVGLYLCISGTFMDKLKEVHDHCLANNQELEIVLVCVSLFDDPKSFKKDLRYALKLRNIKSWFLFKYNSKVCRRMCRIFGQQFVWPGDRFIIIPPNCKSGELEGRAVIKEVGINEYPFTRSAILKRRMDALKLLTPASLLYKGTSKTRTCLVRKGKKFKAKLEGKKFFYYLDWLEQTQDNFCLYNRLIEHYPEIQAMGWEIVFIPLDQKVPHPLYCETLDEVMPWPYMLLPTAVQADVANRLTFPKDDDDDDCNYLIAVGEDGRILSRQVKWQLEENGVTEALFDDVLEAEVAFQLTTIALRQSEN